MNAAQSAPRAGCGAAVLGVGIHLRIAESVLADDPDRGAPVSNPFIFGRSQDVASAGKLVVCYQLCGVGPTTDGPNAAGDRHFTDGKLDLGVRPRLALRSRL